VRESQERDKWGQAQKLILVVAGFWLCPLTAYGVARRCTRVALLHLL